MKVRDDPSFMVDLATGRGAASLLRHKFSSLTARFHQNHIFLLLISTQHTTMSFLTLDICSKTTLIGRMKPYMDARSSSVPSAASCSSASCSAISHSWNPQPGLQYAFSGKGCRFWISFVSSNHLCFRQLKILDINRTNYPKRTIDASGEVEYKAKSNIFAWLLV